MYWQSVPALKRRAIFKHPFGIPILSALTKIYCRNRRVKLQGTDYYRWVFANEPEWQEFQ
jgi:hypothetical protein